MIWDGTPKDSVVHSKVGETDLVERVKDENKSKPQREETSILQLYDVTKGMRLCAFPSH